MIMALRRIAVSHGNDMSGLLRRQLLPEYAPAYGFEMRFSLCILAFPGSEVRRQADPSLTLYLMAGAGRARRSVTYAITN